MAQDKEFLIHCPLDLPPRDQIVALCAITDWNDDASPCEDGWFVSDFYLFHHPMSPRGAASTNQIWLTLKDPVDLVKKYNEYVHGNPRGERRFVLDKYMLDDIFRARNLRVVSRRDLLGRLLGTLREQARIARRQQKQLLIIFVFAHGETKASGVSVGGERRHASAPILHMDAVNRLLPRDVSASLLITSCFSGGWLFRPDLTSSPGYFNVTGTAASSDEKESHSWPQSNNVGRASGSIAASAILQSLINVEEASEETTQHLTYIDLSHSIFESVKAMHRLGEEQQMHFPAENDEWEMHYQHRLGTPACLIQGTMGFPPRNPSILYPVGRSLGTASDPSRSGNVRRCRRLQVLAREYFAANPWVQTTRDSRLKYILRGETNLTPSKLSSLFGAVTYRLGSMHEAECLRKEIGIEFPSIFDVDIVSWKMTNWSGLSAKDRADVNNPHRQVVGLVDPRQGYSHAPHRLRPPVHKTRLLPLACSRPLWSAVGTDPDLRCCRGSAQGRLTSFGV